MQTNRKGRRTVISQNKKGTVSKYSASLKTARALLAQQQAFQETVVLFKKVVEVYFDRPVPEALWQKMGEEAAKAPDWATLDKLVREIVIEFKVNEGL